MLKECDEACGHCEATCNATFHHCITQAAAGKAEHAKMAQMVIDCAAFCTLSAAMIARHSSLMVESCRACAEACRRCAVECGVLRRRRDDEDLRRGVQALRGELPQHGQGHGRRAPPRGRGRPVGRAAPELKRSGSRLTTDRECELASGPGPQIARRSLLLIASLPPPDGHPRRCGRIRRHGLETRRMTRPSWKGAGADGPASLHHRDEPPGGPTDEPIRGRFTAPVPP